MRPELLSVCDQWISAVLNGLWQSIVVTLLAALCLRWLGRSNAATRHAIWLTTLGLVAALIPANAIRGRLTAASPAQDATETFSTGNVPLEVLETPRKPAWSVPLPEPGGLPATPPTRALELEASTFEPAPVEDEPPSDPSTPESSGSRWSLPQIVRFGAGFPRPAGVVLLSLWAMVACTKLIILLARLHQLRRLKLASVPASPDLNELVEDLRSRLGVRREVDLRLSPAHRSAVLVGFLRPAILLPMQAGLPITRSETEQVLRHELAHLRRRDDWANLAQRFIQATLFFHPAVWWISKQLALEREIACDDCVLQQGAPPQAYALLLANLAGRMKCSPSLLTPGVSTSKNLLKQRINMILDTQRNTSPRLAKTRLGLVTSAVAVLAGAALSVGPQLLLAQTQNTSAASAAPLAANSGLTVGSASALPSATSVAPAVSIQTAANIAPAIVGVGTDVAVAIAGPPEDEPAGVGPGDIEPGPKPKPGNAVAGRSPFPPRAGAVVSVTPPVQPVPAVTPFAVATGPVPPMAPYPPQAMAVGGPSPTQRPPRADRLNRNASIEERLAHLEEMVQSLLEQQRGQPFKGDFGFKKTPESFRFDGARQPRYDLQGQASILREQAEREAARARELGQRAAKDAEMKLKGEGAKRDMSQQADAMARQLEAMKKQRQMLEREMNKLSREMERIKQHREKLEEQDEIQEDNSEDSDAPATDARPKK